MATLRTFGELLFGSATFGGGAEVVERRRRDDEWARYGLVLQRGPGPRRIRP